MTSRSHHRSSVLNSFFHIPGMVENAPGMNNIVAFPSGGFFHEFIDNTIVQNRSDNNRNVVETDAGKELNILLKGLFALGINIITGDCPPHFGSGKQSEALPEPDVQKRPVRKCNTPDQCGKILFCLGDFFRRQGMLRKFQPVLTEIKLHHIPIQIVACIPAPPYSMKTGFPPKPSPSDPSLHLA